MTFKEFFKDKHGFDYPGEVGEDLSTVTTRALEAMAEYQDYLYNFIRAVYNRVY